MLKPKKENAFPTQLKEQNLSYCREKANLNGTNLIIF